MGMVHINGGENTLCCSCEGNACLVHRSFFLTLPGVFIVLTDQVGNEGNKNDIPVNVNNTTIDLRNVVAGNVVDEDMTYSLVASVNHHGRSSADGHYDCALFVDKGEALRCNDTKVTIVDSHILLKSNRFRSRTRLYFM